MIEFHETDVIVNGVGLTAESARISQSNSLTPIRTINSNPESIPNGPVVNSIQINYKLALNQDPNLIIIENLKNYITGINCVSIEIAGIECSGYLTNFSLSCRPNESIDASASYVSYFPTTGDISPKRDTIDYQTDYNDLAHSWGTSITYGSTGFIKTYNLDYNISFEYDPVYVFNKKTPNQVLFLRGRESITLTKDRYLSLTFRGKENLNDLISGGYIYINKIGSVNSPLVTLNLSDYSITSSDLNSSINNYLVNQISIEKEI